MGLTVLVIVVAVVSAFLASWANGATKATYFPPGTGPVGKDPDVDISDLGTKIYEY